LQPKSSSSAYRPVFLGRSQPREQLKTSWEEGERTLQRLWVVRNWIQHAVELLLTTEKKAKRKQLAVFLVEDQSTSTIEGADHS